MLLSTKVVTLTFEMSRLKFKPAHFIFLGAVAYELSVDCVWSNTSRVSSLGCSPNLLTK